MSITTKVLLIINAVVWVWFIIENGRLLKSYHKLSKEVDALLAIVKERVNHDHKS